jgi:hypothetical protein
MIPIDVSGEYIVDTGHIVRFTEGLDYKGDQDRRLQVTFLLRRRTGLPLQRPRAAMDPNAQSRRFRELGISVSAAEEPGVGLVSQL